MVALGGSALIAGLATALVVRWRLNLLPTPKSRRRDALGVSLNVIAFVAAARFGWSWSLLPELTMTTGLVALAVVDAVEFRLPTRLLYPTLGATLAGLLVAGAMGHQWGRLLVAAGCAAAAFSVFAVMHGLNPAWLGFGDVRLAGLIGLGVGWVGPLALVGGVALANGAALLYGLWLIAQRGGNRRTPIPMGAFLAAGAVVALVASG